MLEDPEHWVRKKPRSNKFDNNYLYYLYCKWYCEWWEDNHELYNEARLYLFDNISQIVYTAKRKDIVIPPHLHDDCNTEMFMIIDDLYRKNFHDEKIYTIKDLDWTERQWTRFEKYYKPEQVYWMLKMVVRNRIYTYLSNIKAMQDEDSLQSVLHDVDAPFDWDIASTMNTIACEQLVHIVLSELRWVSVGEKWSFIGVSLQGKSYEEVSRALISQWIDYSPYKVKMCVNKVLQNIKENVDISDFNISELL